jgi:ankyrin repeat protein
MLDHGADVNTRGSTTKYPVDQAIFGGNMEAADKLLELQAKFSGEALVEAVDYSSKEYLVPELLRRGADPNTEHERQGNVLQLAIYKGCEESTIRALVEAGADVNAVEGEDGTAIQAAIDRKEENIVRLLLEYGANVNYPACGQFGNPLQIAIHKKSDAITQLLLELGADIHALGGFYGSIIQVAAATGNETLVTHCLSNNVDVNAVGGEYGTALRAAIAMEHEPIVKLLLDAGAEIDIKATGFHSTKANEWTNSNFNSTLEVATASCNTSIFQLLLDHDMALAPEYLENALVQAVLARGLENKLKMLNYLISKGADIKKHGGKALFFACEWSGKIEVVQRLISLGAPLNWSWDGDTGSALMNAIDRDHKDFVLALLDAGADVNLAAGRSGTALIQAIEKGNKIIALELLDRGADPNIKAGSEGTALTVAVKKGDEVVFSE